MGKEKENIRNLFKESIDPRFTGSFNIRKCSSGNELNSTDHPVPSNEGVTGVNHKVNDNSGFQNFIGTKLADYLDKHIKEVNRPVIQNEFFSNRLESIRIFSESDLISEEQLVKSVVQKPPKKKRKKEKKNKESFSEVAVTYEWLQKQAQMLKT